MTYRFGFAVTSNFTELRLHGPAAPIAVGDWSIEAPTDLLPGVDLARRLQASDQALDDGPVLFIEHRAIAGLTAREAALIGLPPLADAMAAIASHGLITRPDFAVSLAWQRPTGQAIAGAERCGAWLRIGDQWRRLPEELFDLAERIDQLNAVPADDTAARMAALAALRDILPPAEAAGKASSSGLVRTMSIAVADAFSLDLSGEGEASRLVPILHRAGSTDDAPLLPDTQQHAFGDDQFHRFTTVRPLYAIGNNTYVVLSPPLRVALEEVRRVQGASLASKRALLASPRAFLRQVLGDDADGTVVESVFRETEAYSDRVRGLGLWQARVLPWIALPANDWFGTGTDNRRGTPTERPRRRGLTIDDRSIPLSPEEIEQLHAATEVALERGEPAISFTSNGETLVVPATAETLVALSYLQQPHRAPTPPAPANQAAVAEHLLIQPNEDEVNVEADWAPRSAPEPGKPASLRTRLKTHQENGLDWLQSAWTKGRPGVLLGDDMGLGKTLQALAFLAWLREGMQAGRTPRAPLLIVAPTGLLENWCEEHDRHLRAPGLGRILRAYGKGLAEHRAAEADGRPSVSVDALRGADCVLTTYETLRDYDRDFGRVRFAAAVLDEAQKIKTPGIRLTDAAKAMNIDFHLAMTGTPVENRLSDLWCIVDTVHPGYLGDLKEFSSRYEKAPDEAALRTLKDQLDRPRGGRPPLLLRRLRWDHLPDLPSSAENVIEQAMPDPQRAAYEETIAVTRTSESRGAMLSALQALRRISLHPDIAGPEDDEAFINASARLIVLVGVLDTIRDRGERALVFLDDREMQARLSGLIQRRYRLPSPPMIINGAVPGAARQVRVNRFQATGAGFDVMLLSPRAGGVGLTLTSANHVIHLERWWNPAVEDQCTGRVLRIGQTRPVTVHVPQSVCPGRRSFDQNLHALLQRKRELVQDTLGAGEVSEDESLTLLRDTIA
jgi:SNF2-related domain/Helicase conserved C-terminal domain